MRKISEVIAALQAEMDKHGDIDLVNERGESIADLEYSTDGDEPAIVFDANTNDFE
jgi:hypothetical protein